MGRNEIEKKNKTKKKQQKTIVIFPVLKWLLLLLYCKQNKP